MKRKPQLKSVKAKSGNAKSGRSSGSVVAPRAAAAEAVQLPADLQRGVREWELLTKRQQVISEIRERHRARQPLSYSTVPSGLRRAALLCCGSWRAAIESAGFDYEANRMQRSARVRNEVLTLVRRAVASLAQMADPPLVSTLLVPARGPINRLFGGLSGALRAAGFDPTLFMRHVPVESRHDKVLLEELREFVRNRPGMKSKELFVTRLGREALRRFSSREAVIDKIGSHLWPARRQPTALSRKEVVRGLRARYRRHRHMSKDRVWLDEPRLVHAAYKHFGTWRAAMHAAGLGELVGVPPGTPGTRSKASSPSHRPHSSP